MIDPELPRCPTIASASAPSMKSPARTAVAFESSVAPARAPNADWLLPPPNAAAMSPLALLQQDDHQQQEADEDVNRREQIVKNQVRLSWKP